MRVEAWVSDGGVYLSMHTDFVGTVNVSEPTLDAGNSSGNVSLWPLDGKDHEGEDLEQVRLPAGTAVQLAGGVRPDCGDVAAASQVVFGIRVRSATEPDSTARFVPADPDDVVKAFEEWCRRPPTVQETGFRSSPNGDMEFYLEVTNPGSDDVTVETPRIADEHVTWEATKTEVPGGGTAQLTINGQDVGCEPGEVASWREGRLLIDGEPYEVESSDAWC